MYAATLGGQRYVFDHLATLMAQATPARSGDQLARLSAPTEEARVAAQYALADLPLRSFLEDLVVPYEADEVTRLIIDTHDAAAFQAIAHLTVGGFRDWLLSDEATPPVLAALAPRRHPGDGRRPRQDQPPTRLDGDGGEVQRRDAISQYDWVARSALGSPPAESSYR
jgi:ethanolamine ammonia-lyase large subunit